MLACCRRPRERFLVILLLHTGLRIGEALGLRRERHAPAAGLPRPGLRGGGCARARAAPGQPERRVGQVPVPAHGAGQRRGARPLTPTTSTSAPSWWARDGTEMVLVNLYHEPLGAPMNYRAAKRFFDRLAGECGFPVRPHMLRHTAATNWVRAGVDSTLCEALLGHASLASTTVYLHARDEDKRRAVRPSRPGSSTGDRARAAVVGIPGGVQRAGRDPSAGGAGWLDWLRTHLDPAWRPGEWDGAAKLFTGDLHSDRTAAWPCRTPGCPTATRHRHGRCDGCRRARTGAGLSWEDYDAAPPRHPIRPLLPVGRCSVPGCESDCTAGGCVSGMNGPGAADRSSPSRISPPGPARSRVPRTAWSPAATREHVSRRGLCRFHDNRYLRTDPDARSRRWAGRRWVAAERTAARGAPVLPGRAARVARHRGALRAATARPVPAADGSHPGADPAGPPDRDRITPRRRPANRLRERRHRLQLRDHRTVPGPAPSPGPGLGPAHRHRPDRRGPVAGGAAGPAPQRFSAVGGDPRGGRLPAHRACLAAGNREGLGPRHPAAPAAAPGDAPRLPGRVPHPDRRRAGRPGDPGGRRLHPDHRRHQPGNAAPTAPCTRPSTATCCSTSSARSSNTAAPAG